ncbi:MAG: HNH endonuclease [Pikeienuella sp.]|uniref:HNH endonuclease n=1 Tax=Pikeienuella sp. TaxID=2831957 RepID=UPI00391AED98
MTNARVKPPPGSAAIDKAFYKSKEWAKMRAKVMREEPTCRMCGSDSPRAVADHIIPRRVRPDLALVRGNIQRLCRDCHEREKARFERYAYGIKKGFEQKPQAVSADGVHLDSQHPWARRG